ncbi:MAG: hypothetical protein WC922_08855, partial [Synergistaceae bacterium]
MLSQRREMPQLLLEEEFYPILTPVLRAVHGFVGAVDDIRALFIIRPEVGNAHRYRCTYSVAIVVYP